ncbi:MAG: 4-hydroxy-3-methylbut-2-enyl diphosphate reductase [Bacteroidales bacterium]|nr:4-hydroxy-3-methylbut-2-enyl diphosphate reductase [Bacteroidales bacterium]MDE7465145.1 4-hydroxy-3-methylbut-2-enyl diphosphate reductase [Muribaculaceae bacterium]
MTHASNRNQVVEIDENSGFCFGVVTAIEKAEAELGRSGELHCLGDIVHNASEVERLRLRGLNTITHSDLENLHDATVLLRAHGEPPSTYETARRNNISIVDATCPVVLQLQKRIKRAYDEGRLRMESGQASRMPLILIYGKEGHAEVNGLVGQTDGTAIVVQSPEDLDGLDLDGDVLLYSQTTQSLDGFHRMIEAIRQRKKTGEFEYSDTICRQVANRLEGLRNFAAGHDAVVFVSGAKSSNGKVLFEECRKVNPRTYLVSDVKDLDLDALTDVASIGICGATSTPRWLMTRIADIIRDKKDNG